MSYWYEVKVVSTAVVLVEMETEDAAEAQQIVADEGPPLGVDDVEIVECSLIDPAQVESAKRHADETIPLEML